MNKYRVSIDEIQFWTYQYEVEAKSSEEALTKAESLHFEGVQAYDNWINQSEITRTEAKDITL